MIHDARKGIPWKHKSEKLYAHNFTRIILRAYYCTSTVICAESVICTRNDAGCGVIYIPDIPRSVYTVGLQAAEYDKPILHHNCRSTLNIWRTRVTCYSDRVEFSIVIVRMLNGPLLRLGAHLKRGFQDLNSRVQVVRLTASSVPSGGELHLQDIRFVCQNTPNSSTQRLDSKVEP